MLRRFYSHLFLTLALVFAQQAGFAHAVGHLAGERAPLEKQLPHSKACEQCVAHAPLAAGAVSGPPAVVAEPGAVASVLSFAGILPARRITAHPSRAPPFLA